MLYREPARRNARLGAVGPAVRQAVANEARAWPLAVAASEDFNRAAVALRDAETRHHDDWGRLAALESGEHFDVLAFDAAVRTARASRIALEAARAASAQPRPAIGEHAAAVQQLRRPLELLLNGLRAVAAAGPARQLPQAYLEPDRGWRRPCAVVLLRPTGAEREMLRILRLRAPGRPCAIVGHDDRAHDDHGYVDMPPEFAWDIAPCTDECLLASSDGSRAAYCAEQSMTAWFDIALPPITEDEIAAFLG